ncbi:MAG: class I SAM-dependent methyltransferase, partial [Nitrososphaeraceae archaeon]
IGSEANDWTYNLFVQHPHLFLPILENQKPKGELEATALERIFDEFDVPRRSKILDLSCGIGTHSINLAKKGYQVVGYDPSPLYIEKAKQTAIDEIAGAQSKIRFYQAESNRVAEVLLANAESDFHAMIVFNSMGFVGESHDIQMLTNIFKLAAANCILVMETENRDWIIQNLQAQVKLDLENLEIHETWRFNLETSTAESRSNFYEKNTNGTSLRLVLDLNTSIRLYSLHELIRIINLAGWKYIKSLGDILTLEQTSSETPDIFTISQKI